MALDHDPGESKSSRPRFIQFLFLLGTFFVMVEALDLLITVFKFDLGMTISGLELPLAIFIGVVFMAILIPHSFGSQRLTLFTSLLGVAILVFGISLALAQNFYDLSSDGQTYHASAILELTNGWNPIRDPPLPDSIGDALILNHWSKGSEITAATIYKITGLYETGKAWNIVLLVAAFLISLSTILFLTLLRPIIAGLVALLLVWNPITSTVMFTFMPDGQMASLLLIMVCASLISFRRTDIMIMIALASAIILAINLKFSGVAYVGLIGVGVLAWRFFAQRKLEKSLLVVFVLSGLVGTAFGGFNPYVTNTLRNGHPFYPTNTPTFYDDMLVPKNMIGRNGLQRFWMSLIGQSALSPEYVDRKLPFTISPNELATFRTGETRIGGFGPLFSGIFLLAGIALLLALFVRRQGDTLWIAIVWMIFLLSLTVLLNPVAWVPRYIPQLWFIPLLVVLIALTVRNREVQVLAWVIVGVILVNSAMVSWVNIPYQYQASANLRAQLVALKARTTPVPVYFSNFIASRIRMDEAHIQYVEMEQGNCIQEQTMVGSESEICTP